VLQKPKPNRNLKFSEKHNRNPTRPWVEDTADYIEVQVNVEAKIEFLFDISSSLKSKFLHFMRSESGCSISFSEK
jgi:hypothetical protein